jgi:hypothetical protein
MYKYVFLATKMFLSVFHVRSSVLPVLVEPQQKMLNCSETALTGETWFHYESGCIPRMGTADPLDGKQTVDPLDQ